MAGLEWQEGKYQREEEYLKKGAEVEVSSKDPGFLGAWYVATIVEPPTGKKKKAVVKYKTLLCNNRRRPLTEHADLEHLRPPPPPLDGPLVLEENDAVDARYSDGWWSGVVHKVLDDSRVRVFFENPPDVIDFDLCDLRPHFDWVNGAWIRRHKQQFSGSIFGPGREVEVNTHVGDFHDVWYPAVVIEEFGNDTFLVKYLSSKGGDESGTGKVVVDIGHVRPTPPCNVVKNFGLLEKVDAQYSTGWRPGVITKLLTGGRYNVYFKPGNADMECNESQLRPRAEWLNGKWLGTSKEDVVVSNNQHKIGDTKNGVGKTLKDAQIEISKVAEGTMTMNGSISKSQMEQSADSSVKALSHQKPRSKNKRKLAELSGYKTPSNSSQSLKERDFAESLVLVAVPESVKRLKEMPTEETLSDLASSEIRVKRCRSKKAMVQTQSSAKTESSSPMEKTKQRMNTSIDGQKMDIARVPASEDVCKLKSKTTKVETPVILGLLAKGMKISGHSGHFSLRREDQTLRLIRNQKSLANITVNKSPDLNQHKDRDVCLWHGESSQRRGRGRPRKLVTPHKLQIVRQNESEADFAVEDHITRDLASPISKGEATGDADQEKISDTNGTIKDVKLPVCEIPQNVADDDQPLVTWIGGMHSPATVMEPKSSSSKSVNGCNSTPKRRGDASGNSPVDGADVQTVSYLTDSLPFAKRSPIWNTIESMEIFKIAPQKPHFSPLTDCKVEYREGLAIGLMVTFSSLFDRISSLQFDDSSNTFEGTLDSLIDLEKHGFNVSLLRDRLNALKKLVESQGEWLHESKDAETKIEELKGDKAKLNKKIELLHKKILELNRELASSKSEMKAKELEITKLASCVDSMKGRIENARNEFKNVVNSSWKPAK